MQINRLFDIIYLLLDKKTLTANELAEHFEVSVRTIYRDIDTLCEAGIPLYCDRGRNGGVRLTESFILNKSLLSDKEKTDILSGLQSLSATGAGDSTSLKRISAFLGGGISDWVAIDFSDWSDLRKQLFNDLKNAIIERYEVVFDYYNTSGTLSRRRVKPVQLWFKSHNWYLRAFCLEKNAMRLFKLSRMHRLEQSTKHFAPFAVSEELPIMSTAPSLPVTLRINKSLAYRVYDDFEETEISVLETGDFLVKPFLPTDEWVIGLILSYGPYAEVLSPPEFRRHVGDQIMNTAKIYNN